MAETWKTVSGYDGMYEVSDHGRVRSWWRDGGHPGRREEPRTLKAGPDSHGYPRVDLCKNRTHEAVKVHRVVLTAFVGPCPPGLECCHGDGDKANNDLSNLRWDTRSSNHRDAIAHGAWVLPCLHAQGEAHGSAKLTEENVTEVRRLYAAGRISHRELGSRFGVSPANIGHIVRRKTWTHLEEGV